MKVEFVFQFSDNRLCVSHCSSCLRLYMDVYTCIKLFCRGAVCACKAADVAPDDPLTLLSALASGAGCCLSLPPSCQQPVDKSMGLSQSQRKHVRTRTRDEAMERATISSIFYSGRVS